MTIFTWRDTWHVTRLCWSLLQLNIKIRIGRCLHFQPVACAALWLRCAGRGRKVSQCNAMFWLVGGWRVRGAVGIVFETFASLPWPVVVCSVWCTRCTFALNCAMHRKSARPPPRLQCEMWIVHSCVVTAEQGTELTRGWATWVPLVEIFSNHEDFSSGLFGIWVENEC